MQATVTESEQVAGQKVPVPDNEGVVAQSNRDRVRGLLFDPLSFRFPRSVDAEAAKKALNRIADDLAYLSDASLAALRDIMRTKGEGSSRNFWPDHATFIGFAEVIQRRPIEDLPALSSWFGSIEGPRAAMQGILVETFLFIADRKMPPVTDGARRQVASKAAENARRLQIIAERRAAEMAIDVGELEFERWYRDQRARCEALMRSERAKRGHTDDEVAA
jgi:hypothetical protein